MRRFDAGVDRLFYSRHPLMQGFYLLLVTGSVITFMLFGWQYLPNEHAPPRHQYIYCAVVAFTYYSFISACRSNPGILTPKNVDRANTLYDHDYILFSPKLCKTCLLDKPARSKHCSLCKHCIAKADHHCAWLNTCVGHANYPHFLRFLAATQLLCLDTAYLCARLLQARARSLRVWELVVRDPAMGGARRIEAWEAVLWLTQREAVLTALGAFAALCALVVGAFMAYQVWTVGSGKTTNEVFKWEDLEFDLKHGEVHISSRTLRYNQEYGKPFARNEMRGGTLDRLQQEARTGNATEGGAQIRQRQKKVNGSDAAKEEEDVNIPFTTLNQVRNIYDRGFLRNLWDTLFPEPLDE
ncbi:DHHC palmitoyltransferase-domain-containing protein [Chytriomyces sp. MP71]|nr:DHHC palmitoyltransferase-domain-containing protein [Chytriomyces sp. MP71]